MILLLFCGTVSCLILALLLFMLTTVHVTHLDDLDAAAVVQTGTAVGTASRQKLRFQLSDQALACPQRASK